MSKNKRIVNAMTLIIGAFENYSKIMFNHEYLRL